MNCEPNDISLQRTANSPREKQSRHGSPARPFFASSVAMTAPPEAFDEVFASLARIPTAETATAAAPTKPSLSAAPWVALTANLERQHERLSKLLREIETGAAAS
jgi:hypothetical protein